MPGTKTSGNRSARRGRKLLRTIHLSREAAQTLRTLMAAARSTRPALTEEQYVEELIERAWRDYDKDLTAVEPWEGGVL